MDPFTGQMNLSSCITTAVNLFAGQANLSSCMAGATNRFASQANLSSCIAGAAELLGGQMNLSSYIVGLVDLFAGQADFIDEMLELSVSASDFDEYLCKHSILFCPFALDATGCRLSIGFFFQCFHKHFILSLSICMFCLGYSCV